MSWRTVVVKNRAKLDYKMNYLVARYTDNTVKVYIDEIYMLIIESTAVSITAVLLNELMKKRVKIIFCDEKRNPHSELIGYYGSHDTSLKCRNQISWSDEIKELVWTEIIKEKIKNQSMLLNKYEKEDSGDMLKTYYNQVEINDITNREGHAAKVYFNSLFGKDFSRSHESNMNSALNYGYAILLSSINREVISMGYLTQFGLFHDNMFNQFNLSCDLMEPFRIFIDEKVLNMNLDKFESEEKMEIIKYFSEYIFIDGQRTTVLNAIKIYCKSIFDALNNEDISLIKFWRYEL